MKPIYLKKEEVVVVGQRERHSTCKHMEVDGPPIKNPKKEIYIQIIFGIYYRTAIINKSTHPMMQCKPNKCL